MGARVAAELRDLAVVAFASPQGAVTVVGAAGELESFEQLTALLAVAVMVRPIRRRRVILRVVDVGVGAVVSSRLIAARLPRIARLVQRRHPRSHVDIEAQLDQQGGRLAAVRASWSGCRALAEARVFREQSPDGVAVAGHCGRRQRVDRS